MKRLLLGAMLSIAISAAAHGQGCSQCRDQVGQTPQRTQQAYRRGIVVLIAAVGVICGATVLVARRYR
jgi:predicted RecA/RadA family phage recombinase